MLSFFPIISKPLHRVGRAYIEHARRQWGSVMWTHADSIILLVRLPVIAGADLLEMLWSIWCAAGNGAWP